MSYCSEPGSHIRDKVKVDRRDKVVLDLSNYEIKKELDHAAGVDHAATSYLAVKNILLL